MASHADLVDRCAKLVECLNLPDRCSVAEAVALIGAQRRCAGRDLVVRPFEFPRHDGRALMSALWLVDDGLDLILYDAAAAARIQERAVAYGLGHIVAGHTRVENPDLISALFANSAVGPEYAKRMLLPGAPRETGREMEQEAALIGELILARGEDAGDVEIRYPTPVGRGEALAHAR